MSSISRNFETSGREMYALVGRLFPIYRSITGKGVRDTLKMLQKYAPVTLHEVPTGTPVFDWETPQEWAIRDAYIKDPAGKRILDLRKSNLHIVNGSVGVRTRMRWSELKKYVHTLPEWPNWIPYRTCFFQERWGFCMTHQQYMDLAAIGDVEYEICIDATWTDGSLTYGEIFLPGETNDEVLISSHICHPSLANDNLSGIAVAIFLAQHLRKQKRRLGYRFVFAPATIGAIAWLSQNERRLPHIQHGLILSLLGDGGNLTYKRSRRGDAEIDRAATHVLKHSGDEYTVVDFEPYGYDERQYCSPGINLPVGCFMRTPNEQYAEYHTSADNLDLVQPQYLADSLSKLVKIVHVLEGNDRLMNLNPKCEPRLGKYRLYQGFGCGENQKQMQRAALWVLNLCDGENSLLDIAERSGLAFETVRRAADMLLTVGLLGRCASRRKAPQRVEPSDSRCHASLDAAYGASRFENETYHSEEIY